MKKVILVVLMLVYPFCLEARKKAMVIGASSGMGRSLALLLARTYDVALVARRSELLDELKAFIKGDVPSCTVWTKSLDVTDSTASEQLDAFIEEIGGLDLLVISITSHADTIDKPSIEQDNALIAVDLLGFWKMARCALAFFKKQGSGHLVGISSIDALRGSPVCPLYSATKAFVSRYLEGIRNQLHAQGYRAIYVTDILPGYVQTEAFDSAAVPGAYWVATVHDAAIQIQEAIESKEKRAFITSRWWIIGWLMGHLPDWLFYDVLGGL